jgi:hypothetical protein
MAQPKTDQIGRRRSPAWMTWVGVALVIAAAFYASQHQGSFFSTLIHALLSP